MSGSVLDRMAQRARGTLATAEPRVPVSTLPLHASAADAAGAEWVGEEHVQVENRRSRPDQRLTSAPMPGNAPATSRPARNASSESAQRRAAADEGPKMPEPAAPYPVRLLRALDGELSRPSHRSRNENPDTSEATAGSSRPALQASAPAENMPQQLAQRAGGEVQSPGSDERSPFAQSQAGANRDASIAIEAAGEGGLQIIHEHREVSISIGTISMQSTPQAAPHRAPAFRPRVSLDAFLERRQGSR